MASGGRGRGGRGRGSADMQKAYEEYQRELMEIQSQNRGGQPTGLSSLSHGLNVDNRSRHSSDSHSSVRSGTGSVETPDTTPTPPDSDSPPLRSPSPVSLLRPRGRGRGLSAQFNRSPGDSSGSGSESTASPTPCPIIAGPLRPQENILMETPGENSPLEDDDFVARFRRMNADAGGVPRGRGIGRGRGLPVTAISTDLVEQPSPPRPLGLGRGRGSLFGSSSSSLPPSAGSVQPQPRSTHSGSGSSVGSDIAHDLEVLQREIIVKRGTKGKIVPVTCNYIRLKIKEHTGRFEYHVDFDPIFDSRKATRQILKSREDILGTVRSFDGAKLFLPFRLPNRRTEFVANDPFEVEKTVKVTIRFIRENNVGECVHFYNILFRRIMEVLGLVEMKRNFFDYRCTHSLPQHKLEIWPGYITAVDEYEGGLMLMCDSASRVLRTTSLLDVLHDMSLSGGDFQRKFEEHAVGQIIVTKYNKRNYHVDGVDWDLTPLSTFSCRGVETTYLDYYLRTYNITISNLQPPLIVNKPKDKRLDPRRPVSEIVYLIPELCFVTGMSADITSNYKAMQDMSQYTRLPPQKRNTCIKQFVQNVKGNPEAKLILSGWGLELEDGGIEIEARQFSLSTLVMGNGVEIQGTPDFTRESMNNPCYTPVPVRRYAIFCTAQNRNEGTTFLHRYPTICRNIGIQVNSEGQLITIDVPHARRQYEEFRKKILQTLHPDLQFIVIIMPRQQDDLYGMVKKICCVENAIPSQVILAKTLQKENRLQSVMAKIALQINCKLGGALWTIKIPLPERIMFVGMDVYHDPKGRADSVTALVASTNPVHTKYFSRVANQRPGQETMNTVRGMFREALQTFYQENNRWPDRIVVYRDGVGDGQLEMTENHEVVQLTETMSELCENQPKFTFAVVQKRINTRIFGQGVHSLVNPEPGTVLDHTVTRRYYYDFFLVSQLVREGTVTPTHYIVLKDNAETPPDLIQKLAFVTSFMYYNWAGSIRVPAVCQYAHKLAFLVGQHLKAEPSRTLNQQLYYL